MQVVSIKTGCLPHLIFIEFAISLKDVITGGLEPSLSTWLRFLPIDVTYYYLPSHLILASLFLRNPSTDYPSFVTEALILPPDGNQQNLDEIDENLIFCGATVKDHGDDRLNLYRLMTEEQRNCIAKYLSLYLEYNRSSFTEKGLQLFYKNRNVWQESSL